MNSSVTLAVRVARKAAPSVGKKPRENMTAEERLARARKAGLASAKARKKKVKAAGKKG